MLMQSEINSYVGKEGHLRCFVLVSPFPCVKPHRAVVDALVDPITQIDRQAGRVGSCWWAGLACKRQSADRDGQHAKPREHRGDGRESTVLGRAKRLPASSPRDGWLNWFSGLHVR